VNRRLSLRPGVHKYNEYRNRILDTLDAPPTRTFCISRLGLKFETLRNNEFGSADQRNRHGRQGGKQRETADRRKGRATMENSNQPMVEIYGRRGSAACYSIRDFLHRSDVPFRWIELASDEQARAQAGVGGLDDTGLPVCIFPDGTRLENATVRQITEKLGWFRDPSRTEYDLAIYGAGPAGLSAAVYGASEGLSTILIERYAVGGQASCSPNIENYLGFPEGISGAELAERSRRQACRFGAEILVQRKGVRGEIVAGKGVGYLEDGTKIVARASVCATGVDYRRLGLPHEDRLFGAGVYYGAGASEAMLCGRQEVYLVGGGNSGGQAALHFARYAAGVTMVVREDSLGVNMSEYLIDRIRAEPKVKVLLNTEVIALHGDRLLHAITLRNNQTGQEWTAETGWLFLCLGGVPQTQWAAEAGVICDSGGYVVTGADLLTDGKPPDRWDLDRKPYAMETSLPGVFAAGDVRAGSIKRCASAVGEGAWTIASVHRYLADG
jgi:thioredoxin reductase (NADPH)